MHYAISPEQKKFFGHCGSILFEDFWESDETSAIAAAIENALLVRLGTISGKQLTLQQCFAMGHDLWRFDPFLKKSILSGTCADLAAELFEKKPLRIAYDQYLPAWNSLEVLGNQQGDYGALVTRKSSLIEMSSIQGMLGGLLICITSPATPLEGEVDTVPWPQKCGSVAFFKPNVMIDFRALRQSQSGSYLLITYCRGNAVYFSQPGDPQLHALKAIGYSFGDRLKDTLNPIVAR